MLDEINLREHSLKIYLRKLFVLIDFYFLNMASLVYFKSIASHFHMNTIKSKFRIIFRRSRRDVFFKKGVLENFAKFKGKHLCQSLFFNKVACKGVFLLKFTKFLRTPCFTEHLGGCFCIFPLIFFNMWLAVPFQQYL